MPLPETLGFQSQFFNLPDLRVHTAVAGPENGAPVILLHGFPEFWYSWRHQIKPLAAAGYRVIVPDQRGYNLTDKTGPYDTRTLARDIINLMDANGFETVNLAGHDWGAMVAWMVAGLYPTRIKRLAILNVPHPNTMRKALLFNNWAQIKKSWYIFYFQLPLVPERSLLADHCRNLKRMMYGSARKGTFSPDDMKYYVTAWEQPGALSAMIGWYRTIFNRTATGRDARISAITTPTRILWGEKDIALGVELAEQSMKYVKDGQLIRYPNATHWVHEDEPEAVTQQLLDHFRD